jgi:hypothetical protein
MKLKKGSKEARDFMAKIRAKKSLGAVKKRQMPKQNKKEIGTRKFQNNTEMVLKGYDHNGNELWVTAKYYDKPKMNERKKSKKSTLKGNKHTDNKSHNYKVYISGISELIKDRDIWEKMLKAKKWIIKQKENVLKMNDISKEYKKECASDIKLYKKQILTIKKEIRLLNSQISK